MGRLIAGAAFAAGLALAALPAGAEPASADPTYALADRQIAGTPKTLAVFDVVGADVSVVATGRLAFVDTRQRGVDLEEALEMGKVMPGYPQPAYVTFDLKLSF